MKMHMNFMRSSGGKRDVAYYVYVPDGAVRGIVQISHGMCDYVENYALLAERLTAAGLVVCGNDHLGHGNTAEDARDLGYFAGGSYEVLLKDLRKMNRIIRSMYKGVPLVLLGLLLSSAMLVDIGIVAFSMSTLFQLVTLPVEFNASRRAVATLDASCVSAAEVKGAKAVLRAAALTYVAALAVSLASLLRLILLFGGRNRRD